MARSASPALNDSSVSATISPTRRLIIRGDDALHVVRVEDVSWFAAAGNYAVVHAGKRSHILRESMNSLESRLDSNRFLRVSRGALVNLDSVSAVVLGDNGSPVIRLEDGTLVPTSMGIRELQRRLECP